MDTVQKSILIVEDEPQQLGLLQAAFEREGYLVHTATGGLEGLEKLKTAAPRVVLLDLIMPLGDGITLLYKINTDPALKNTPVVILTNLAIRDEVKNAMNLQKDYFFTKTAHTLQEIIQKVKEVA
ncbi:response regulator [Candidatus Azambacteria bacterium]|nr:response regulator [Candidatus Azambacteria bacterium]